MMKMKKGEFEVINFLFYSKKFSWILLISLGLLIAFLTTMSIQQIPSDLFEGMIATRDIKADRNYDIVDIDASEGFKKEAVANVLPVYDFDEVLAKSVVERVKLAFANARVRYDSIINERNVQRQKGRKLTFEEKEELRKLFSQSLGVFPSDEKWDAMLADGFDEKSEKAMLTILSSALVMPIVAERAALDAEAEKGVTIRKITGTDESGNETYEESALKDVSFLRSTEEVREAIRKLGLAQGDLRDENLLKRIKGLAIDLIEPNCVFNRNETKKRRDEAANNVKNVILKVKSGEMIIREGARYEPTHIKILEGIRTEKRRGIYPVDFLATFFLMMILITVPFYLAEKFFIRVRPTKNDHFLMAAVGLSMLVIIRLSIILAPGIQNAIFFNIPVSSMYFGIPIAAGAMLLRMYLGAEITMVFAVVISLIAGIMLDSEVGFVVFSMVASFAAIIAVTKVDKRSAIIKAGMFTGFAGMLTVLGVVVIDFASGASSVTFTEIFWDMFLAFLGGIGCSIYAMIGMPIVESSSNYTSDIKLLELANLNHPLLRELIVRAPGTYHHSHLVGVLGEAAAEAIGANALLVRVGAYYHDIGKMKKPQYFIENAKSGENRHERISPNMSALIVSAHVKDGIEMAENAGLPLCIADMIPQHHGTRTMSFFYNKAKELEDPAIAQVDDREFKYPGPKPQTREAAILMLADVIEASVRALKEKSPVRIQQTVQRAINDIFAESQLDECDLTLKDLNAIASAFSRILLGIYHQRIEYPKDENGEKNEINVVDENSTNTDLSD
jgi:hypothetical protein